MLPMQGVTIISIEQALAAPLATAKLAEAGARVIKIERQAGDFSRNYDAAAKGDSSYFVWTNQGKESVVLDIKNVDDKEFLKKLISKADVFIQNLAPGALGRVGLDSASLRSEFPHLITCDISGYGENPEVSHMKAYDFLIQSETGLVSISGGENELGRVGVSIVDIGAGMTAHAAITEALLLKSRTNEGSAIKISLFDVAAEWMTVPLVHYEHGDGAPKREGLRHPSIAPYGAYPSKDKAETIISIQSEREWQVFCKDILEEPSLSHDARFNSNNNRVKNRDEMDETISEKTQIYSSEELRNRLAHSGIAYGAVNQVSDLSSHPALRRKTVVTTRGETLTIPAPPIFWVEKNCYEDKPVKAPSIGENTDLIVQEFGY